METNELRSNLISGIAIAFACFLILAAFLLRGASTQSDIQLNTPTVEDTTASDSGNDLLGNDASTTPPYTENNDQELMVNFAPRASNIPSPAATSKKPLLMP